MDLKFELDEYPVLIDDMAFIIGLRLLKEIGLTSDSIMIEDKLLFKNIIEDVITKNPQLTVYDDENSYMYRPEYSPTQKRQDIKRVSEEVQLLEKEYDDGKIPIDVILLEILRDLNRRGVLCEPEYGYLKRVV